MTTPENITKRTDLPENGVFVFGSNMAGQHLGGAAKVAYEHFGATWGVGSGRMGQSYAFATLNHKLEKYDDKPYSGGMSPAEKHFTMFRNRLYKHAANNPETTFYLTRVGCGLASYSEEFVKQFFKVKLSNIIYPEGF